ncbi:hypothetical protein [Polymorphospora lycopeni]|uniref:Secreted protein n=1 Tax=Polymorphospora lycopeni TaxID=3140240 RepID=A0ABV5CKM9_9ACTN
MSLIIRLGGRLCAAVVCRWVLGDEYAPPKPCAVAKAANRMLARPPRPAPDAPTLVLPAVNGVVPPVNWPGRRRPGYDWAASPGPRPRFGTGARL